jgi:nucleotide-binding universal stress UspA family protein
MVDIKRILCPVDFSEFSRHALAHAVQLARWYGSALTVLHVYPPPVPTPPVVFGGLPGPIPPALAVPWTTASPERTQQEVLEYVKMWASNDTAGLSIEVDARPGPAAASILEEAAERRSDLIVLGTHGHSGFDRLVLGSVTEKVLRKALCPVLTVPPAVASPPREAVALFKRILCPLDFSDASLKALDYALSLAKEADAELLLLHAIESLPESANWKMSSTPAVVEYLRLYEHDALERLRAVIPDEARGWCSPHVLLVSGRAHAEILRVARERDVQLIVMGVHGRNTVERLFFGSTTNHVVRAAACPVLSVTPGVEIPRQT